MTIGGTPESGKQAPGAGDETRTRGLNLGKVVLYQLSYPRTVLALSTAQTDTMVIRLALQQHKTNTP